MAVIPNPVLFTLENASTEDTKENKSPVDGKAATGSATTSPSSLPYRSIFCVLTWDSVVIYDTVQDKPLSICKGLHYANLVGGCWSESGEQLIVCSTDGYLSVISFAPGELGQPYQPPPPLSVHQQEQPKGAAPQTTP